MSEFIKIVLLIVLIAFLIIIGPILTIWALNTLFPVLAIKYGIAEWFAVIILGAFIRAKVSYKKD
jgi:hypothetical protein